MSVVDEIERWKVERGGLPLLDDVDCIANDPPWGEPSWWQGDERDLVTDDELADRLLEHLDLPDTQDEIGRCIAVCSVSQQSRRTWIDWGPDSDRRRQATLRCVGRRILDDVPVERLAGSGRLAWEMIAAAQFDHWQRVSVLYHAWLCSDHDEAERAIARARTVRALMRQEDVLPEMWLDYRAAEPKLRALADRVLLYLASAVGGPSEARLEWTGPENLAGSVLQGVYEASDLFDRLDREQRPLSLVELALAGWCDAVIGKKTRSPERLRRSVRMYATLRRGNDAESDRMIDRALALTITRLCCWIPDFPQASEHAEALVTLAPEDPWAWELLAQVRRGRGDTHGWVEAYERFVCLKPDSDHDWERTELLQLGLRHREAVSLTELIAAVPPLKSDVELTRALLQLEWPEFTMLTPQAQERWIAAVVYLSHPRVATAQGDLRWAPAVEAVGEAVASQLKAEVVAPFREWLVANDKLRELEQGRGPESQLIRSIRSNSVTMGTIAILLRAGTNKSGETGPLFNGWLHGHAGAVAAVVLDRQVLQKLERLTRERNPAAHELMSSTTESRARESYQVARSMLTELMKARPNS